MAAIDALVLAAGASSRLAPHNKLLARGADGQPLIARTLAGLRGAGLREIIVVVGHQHERVEAAIGAAPVRVVRCAGWAAGLSRSLHAGLGALRLPQAPVLICLGDMPLIDAPLIDAMRAAWQPGAIVLPVHAGRRGNPVLWDPAFLPELLALTGDSGARALLRTHAARLRRLDWPTDAILRDADTAEALRALPGGPWRAEDGSVI